MAGIKISGLPAVVTPALTDTLPVVQGGVTKKETITQVLAAMAPIPAASGGTGVNNGSRTLTLAGSLVTSGAFASTFTMTGVTNVTFPTSGTLSTTTGTVTSITAGTNLTGGVITTSGTIALSATPNGLTSLNAGNLTLVGDTLTGTGSIVTVSALTSGSSVNLSPNNSFVSITDFGNTVATPLRFYNAAGTHFVAFKTTTGLAADTTWIWPTADAKGLMGSDGSGNFSLRTLTNGQIFIGSTGNVATAATLTAGSGVSITNGAGSITIAASGGGLAFVNQNTSSVTMAANTTYFINNGASLVTLTLPTTFAAGDVFRIVGFSSGGWKIAQNASQLIQIGASTSTTGTAGFISSTVQSDGVEIVGIVANTTLANCVAPQGNITVT